MNEREMAEVEDVFLESKEVAHHAHRSGGGDPAWIDRPIELLRADHTDAQIAGAIGLIWQGRDDRYSELRASAAQSPATTPAARRVEMHYIGG